MTPEERAQVIADRYWSPGSKLNRRIAADITAAIAEALAQERNQSYIMRDGVLIAVAELETCSRCGGLNTCRFCGTCLQSF